MAGKRRKFDAEFRAGAVRIVTETGKPIAQVAQDLGINETTLASWVSRVRRAGGAETVGESEELARLRQENAQLKKDNKELAMERDVLKRCMVWPENHSNLGHAGTCTVLSMIDGSSGQAGAGVRVTVLPRRSSSRTSSRVRRSGSVRRSYQSGPRSV
jgi:transposase